MTLEPFERVVHEHGATVLRVCRALLGPGDADDAWSETFLSALRAYPRIAPGSNVRGWLVTIAHNTAIDHLRRERRRPLPAGEVSDAAVAAPPPEPADEDLRTALARLPPKQRAAVVYRYLADLPYADVGDLIGSSEAAARRSAADGIATLRRTYDTGVNR